MNGYSVTHKQGRKCLHCGAPIADQIHQGRLFCEREVLPNGSVKSCKDDFHALLKKERNEPYRQLMASQKRLSLAIDGLYQEKGPDVTVEDLQHRKIWLKEALRPEPKGDGLFTFVFAHHRLEQLSMTRFKIHPHASPF